MTKIKKIIRKIGNKFLIIKINLNKIESEIKFHIMKTVSPGTLEFTLH